MKLDHNIFNNPYDNKFKWVYWIIGFMIIIVLLFVIRIYTL